MGVSLMRSKAISYNGIEKPHIYCTLGHWTYLAPITIHPSITHAEHVLRVQLIAEARAYCRRKNRGL